MDEDRYWVYAHDADGDLLEDLGNFNDLNPAVTKACEHIGLLFTDDMESTVVRVVGEAGSTVWVAGPVNLIDQYEQGELDS